MHSEYKILIKQNRKEMGAGHYHTHGNGMTDGHYVNEARAYALLAQAYAKTAQETLDDVKSNADK